MTQHNETTTQETLLTIEYACAYGASLQKARRFTEEEKTHFTEWFRDYGFKGVSGTNIDLDGVRMTDMPKRPPDGEFCGCENSAWIITCEEWDAYLSLNEKRQAEKAEKERHAELDRLRHELKMMERQGDLCKDREEARKKEREWNRTYNEGGEGYVPHYYTVAEHDYALTRIKELEGFCD